MDPIPGMNTPVRAADDICSFVNEHGGLNLKATPVNNKESLTVINEQEVLGRHFRIFGTVENPLFLAKDVAEWIEHSNVTEMLRGVDDDEKLTSTILRAGQNRQVNMLTEDGLYEVLMQSRKPIAKQFKKEVKKILKSIRKNGAYIRNQENMTPAEIVARGLIAAQKIIEDKERKITLLNGRCGLLTQTVDEKQETIENSSESTKSRRVFLSILALYNTIYYSA